MKTLSIITTIFLFINCAKAQKNNSMISSKLEYTEKQINVNGVNINYYENGSGPVVLYLHGIPTSSYLWRNVIPITSKHSRSIAMDLAGYGKSDLPLLKDYSSESQYQYIEGFINALKLKDITLVVNDLGSALGLRYAISHPVNIKSIVYLEAVFMPAKEWRDQLPFMQRLTFKMMKNEKRAEKMIVTKNKIPSMIFKMGVKRKLSKEELAYYEAPYKTDEERRRVMLKGPGPAEATKAPMMNWLDKNAEGLKKLDKPMLLLTAKPGMITQKKTIEYAKANFKNIEIKDIGNGKHFLPEDEPNNIGIAINEFILKNNKYTMTTKNQVTGTMFFYYEGAEGKKFIDDFDQQIQPVFKKFEITVKEFKPVSKGQIGGEPNSIEQPDLILVLTAPDMASFQAYLKEPETIRLGEIRKQGMRKIIATVGNEIEADALLSNPSKEAVHSFALVNFNDKVGLANLIEFNRQGTNSGLFKKYGIHPEQFILPLNILPVKGEAGFDKPELLVRFAMDNPNMLKDYLADPEYLKIAPLRDNYLKNYNFFMCK